MGFCLHAVLVAGGGLRAVTSYDGFVEQSMPVELNEMTLSTASSHLNVLHPMVKYGGRTKIQVALTINRNQSQVSCPSQGQEGHEIGECIAMRNARGWVSHVVKNN